MEKLRDLGDRYNDLKAEYNELQEANLYMKNDIDQKDEYIQELEDKEPANVYQPVSKPKIQGQDNFEVENLKKKLKLTEEENERLREQAFKFDKEVERLKENIILREREIYNVKKSIVNKDNNLHPDKYKPAESEIKSKSKSDFMLSFETNKNLVSDFAKMTGSSGFKYGTKGPYDESLEKLRKEFNQQQKDLELETLSEVSKSNQGNYKSPPDKTLALMMGHNILSPTGNFKADFETVNEENQQLKMIIKEMRNEMESVVKQLNDTKKIQKDNPKENVDKNPNYFLPPSQKDNYLDETNLKLLDKEAEIEHLTEEITRLKYLSPSDRESEEVDKLKKKLEEKRKIIEKLKEERDSLLQV